MKIRDDFKRNVTSGKYKINMNGHHGYSRDDFELSVFDDKWTIKYFLDKIMNGLRSDIDWIGIEYDNDPFNPFDFFTNFNGLVYIAGYLYMVPHGCGGSIRQGTGCR